MIRKDMSAVLQMVPGNLRDHDEKCVYRRFIEEDRESYFQTQATMDKELRTKYKTEVVQCRISSKKRKREGRSGRKIVKKPLTPYEEAWVNVKVEDAMTPNGPIQWYLRNQRLQFQQVKERKRLLCDCVLPEMIVDTTTDQPGPSEAQVTETELGENKSEQPKTGDDDAENEEDDVFYF